MISGCASIQKTNKDLQHNPKAYSGGAGTVFNTTNQAFALPLSTLPTEKLRDFTFGNRMFNTNWVTAPASTKKFDGLGPTFNRVSCSACHTFDGRGQPPEDGGRLESMLVRISKPGFGPHGGVKPHPHYGDQLNERSIAGVPAEGQAVVNYKTFTAKYPDGQAYALRIPHYRFKNLAFGPLGDDILFSPRVAPAVFGLGLLESVREETILGFEKVQKKGTDGIQGQPNYVWDEEKQKTVVGRFGWKANQPTLRQQAAAAFQGDIGITNSMFPKENIPLIQRKAKLQPTGGTPELDQSFFDKMIFYSHTLGVPARRNLDDRAVINGEKTFIKIGCAVCHIPTMQTGDNKEIPQLANQTIHPYTDLLLHDMGDGLADGRPDFKASGKQWRTPPLWGIGLVQTVNKHTYFMHDGRARNLEEAILWHGGEAKGAQEKFMNLSFKERQEMIKFLESL